MGFSNNKKDFIHNIYSHNIVTRMQKSDEQGNPIPKWDHLKIPAAIVAVIVVLLILVFSDQISYFLNAAKITLLAMIEGKERLPCGCYGDCTCGYLLMPDASAEHLSNAVQKAGVAGPPPGNSDIATALGYEDASNMAWDEMIKVTDLDPSIHRNHEGFVADVRRFSSGANFTSVQDDDTNAAFTNFVGLRRPQHVDILPDARQQPDIDVSVLQRNKPLIW